MIFPPYKRWFRYGRRSPMILLARLKNKHRPIHRLRMATQRATRGYGDDQLWSLNYAIAQLTVAGVQAMRKWQNGYPTEFVDNGGWEAWEAILVKIEEGFQAWLDEDGWFSEDQPEAEAKFNEGMALFAKWFGALWD